MKGFLTTAIFGTIGLGLLAGGTYAAQDTRQLREVAERVPARVVGMTESSDEDGTTYAPVYEFVFDGQSRRHTASVSSSNPPELGSRSTMLVDPSDPTRVKPDTFLGQWFLAAILGGLGAVFTIVAACVFLVQLLARRGEEPVIGPLGVPGVPPTHDAPLASPASSEPAPPAPATPAAGPFL